MTLNLQQLQAAFKKNENENTSRPNNYYPFWKMNVGDQVIVRFLPDKDGNNPFGFLVEKRMHTLDVNGEKKSVPCLTMYGDDCPVCKVSAAYYKAEDKANGKKFWRKKQHIAQALIVEDPLPPDPETKETHEGKVRFIALSYQLFNVIKEAFESGELDEVPYAYEGGCNFIIKKTKQGDYDNYSIGSKFARKSTDLTEDQIAEVQSQIVELSSLLPANPGVDQVSAMLEASLTGVSLSTDSENSVDNDTPVATSNRNVGDVSDSQPSSTDDDEFEDEAEQILAKIRGRQNQ